MDLACVHEDDMVVLLLVRILAVELCAVEIAAACSHLVGPSVVDRMGGEGGRRVVAGQLAEARHTPSQLTVVVQERTWQSLDLRRIQCCRRWVESGGRGEAGRVG